MCRSCQFQHYSGQELVLCMVHLDPLEPKMLQLILVWRLHHVKSLTHNQDLMERRDQAMPMN